MPRALRRRRRRCPFCQAASRAQLPRFSAAPMPLSSPAPLQLVPILHSALGELRNYASLAPRPRSACPVPHPGRDGLTLSRHMCSLVPGLDGFAGGEA